MKRHPIIVLEGPDAVGKTTWGREYMRQTGARYLHLPLRKRMYEHQAMSLALAVHWSIEKPVLIDRHWPSEQLYAAAYRGGSPISAEAAVLDRVMSCLGVTYVVCLLSSPERMLEALCRSREERHEMYEPDDRYRDLVCCYFDWWHGTDRTETHLGHCESLRGFGNARPLMAHLYDYEQMGRTSNDLSLHVQDVQDIASAMLEATDFNVQAEDLVRDRMLLLNELNLIK